MPQDYDYVEDGGGPVPIRRGRFHVLPIIIFLIFAAGYYFSHQQTVPITGRTQMIDISRQDEIALGLQSYDQFKHEERTISNGPEAGLVKSVGAKIAAVAEAPDFEWEFNLFDSPEVNAFCLPGGKVAVFEGIMPIAQSADGLAVVMGHEIAHAVARHGAERMAQENLARFGQMAFNMATNDMDRSQRQAVMGVFGAGTQFGVLLPFSRKHESEADHIGLILMARACFDPEEAPKFWRRMEQAMERSAKPPEFASTHPSDEKRIKQLEQWLPEAQAERQKYCSSLDQ